jgi:triacylglycerol esterase/lipase EstA (alpha/beta hydrolase family)
MVARICKLILLVQFLAIAAIAGFLAVVLHWPWPAALLFALGFALAVRFLIAANNFRIAARTRSRLPEQYRLGLLATCALLLSEYKATMLSSSWTMPFRRFSRRIPEQPRGLPVLLVHGYGCNSGYWHGMSTALSAARIAHQAIDMEPIIGSIDEYAVLIHNAVEALCRDTGHAQAVVVGHSMGGLAIRAYIRRHGHGRIARAITLGTPHHGTALAHFGIGVNTQQMRWTATEQEGVASDWLQQLAAQESEAVYRLFVSIYSHHDNIISPQTSSHLEGARNIDYHAIGHVALGLHPRIQSAVIHEILDAATLRRQSA